MILELSLDLRSRASHGGRSQPERGQLRGEDRQRPDHLQRAGPVSDRSFNGFSMDFDQVSMDFGLSVPEMHAPKLEE